jgi:HipA-like protein
MAGNRRAEVYTGLKSVGVLEEAKKGAKYLFTYHCGYAGPPICPTMPVSKRTFACKRLPPVFAALLPKGKNLRSFLRRNELEARDYFGQLIAAAKKGALRVREIRCFNMDIDLEDNLYELASALAKKKGISTEEWISNAVTSYFQKCREEKVKRLAGAKKKEPRK